jgi:anti-sigma factor RsiW
MTPCSEHALALHALADGELDAMATVALEAHLRDCPGCRAEFETIEVVRTALGSPDARPRVPQALRERTAALGGEPIAATPSRARRLHWASFGGGGAIGALAASIALLLAVPELSGPSLSDDLVASHVRSLQASHLVDIQTSNRHVVKPWFNGRIDFAPPVPDLAQQGFPLVGGRLDVIGRRTVAAIVYRRGLHTINLFVWPAGTAPIGSQGAQARDSYGLVHWTEGGLDYWAVSDVSAKDLADFARAFRAAARG